MFFLTLSIRLSCGVLVFLVRRAPIGKQDITPPVSLIIAACNEEAVIEAKIKNSLSLDYPASLLNIIVVSDGSTDRTNRILSGLESNRLLVIYEKERKGKNHAFNRALERAGGEIIVFFRCQHNF